MSDVINHIENTKTGKAELWVTIKDASDMLGISERHTWNVVLDNGFQRKKLLNKSRKKTYVLSVDIEKFRKGDSERQRLAALKSSSLSEMSEKKGEFEMSESDKASLSESRMALSERAFKAGGIPALLSEMQNKQEILLKDLTKWRVTTFWVSVLGVVVAGFLYLYLADTKKVLSESRMALSESQKALSEMSEREKQAIKTISERELYVKDLEQRLPQVELDQLKSKRGTNGY